MTDQAQKMADLEAELSRLRAGIADGSLGGRVGGSVDADMKEVATQTGDDSDVDASKVKGKTSRPPPTTMQPFDAGLFEGQVRDEQASTSSVAEGYKAAMLARITF